MSWFAETPLSWIQKFSINIIKCGPVPRHLAIIMDGNRRYARKAKLDKAEGHNQGFNKLSETLQWCRHLGITEVTVYAFSIENFRRPKDEVDVLMDLARKKFTKLLEEKDKLMEYDVRIRIFGNTALLDADIRALIAKIVLLTENNKSYFLNLAFSYTSHDEIANSIETINKGVSIKQILVDDIDIKLLSQCLYSNETPDADIIIRTSGEARFSDFLLWQINSAKIQFADIYWPDFNLWHLLIAVFKYQRCFHTRQAINANQHKMIEESSRGNANDKAMFVEDVNRQRRLKLEEFASYVAS